ncbi:hypothetical protein [Hydrogenimonas urashimensis]|uniref:hypothetical protein n=1 Tax=Hydrogenimonas urashimensis TaxID=2740515 RepID=UPI0019162B86|nr:hypothetical protein [Hydrogenimonas urashimensis]
MIRLTLPLPTYVKAGRQKLLTMNDYRNIHYRVSAEAKRTYKEIAWAHLRPHRRKHYDRVHIHYTIFFETNHRKDIGNVGAVIDKFFSDALVDAKIIPDDCQRNITAISFEYGGIGPERVEIDIKEVA